jgi:histidinol-phosphate aminotransferase
VTWVLQLARPEIRALRAYEHARWEPGLVRLHANELPWRGSCDRSDAGLNRYPEPHPHELTAALAVHYGLPPAMLLPGRGSDEAIDLLVRSYCRAGEDAVVVCPPTFGMYSVSARIQGAAVLEVPLRRSAGFALDAEAIRALCGPGRTPQVKLVFVCSPNNPTGNRLDRAVILDLVRALEGRALLVVDEAYVEFSAEESLSGCVSEYYGLVVLRTLSKALGLAGARCGTTVAHPELIALLRKVIPPYALAQPSIEAILRALQPDARAEMGRHVRTVLSERARVATALAALPAVRRVWPSDTNFLLVEFEDAGAALARAHAAGFLLRDMRGAGAMLGEAVRISMGTPEQNERLLASLS